MSHRRRTPPLPGTLGQPDAGFMAAAGAYAAAAFVGATVAVAAAVGASAATTLGGVSSAITVGLVAGGVVSGQVEGLPERLGRDRRRLALPFVLPAAFAVLALFALSIALLPSSIAVGAGIGALVTAFPALVVASMARTRYAKAMTAEPIATAPLLKPNRDRYWLGLGLTTLSLGVLSLATGEFGRPLFGLWFFGLYGLLYGVALRLESADPDREGRLSGLLPTDRLTRSANREWLPELRVHANGLTVKRPEKRRFVPWSAVTDVRLTDDELVVERRRGLAIRGDRAVIEDAEGLYEGIRRARERSDGS